MADQGMIATYLVEKNMAYKVHRDDMDGSFEPESVADSLSLVMVKEEGKVYREKAKETMALFGDRDVQDKSQNNKTDQNQNEIKNMFACLMNNPSGLGPLPCNTIANPRGDLKAITNRNGVSYDGPPIPSPFSSLPNVVERVPEAVILKKLPKKLGDPDKFLIPCDFSELVECLALADLGASINLMPLSIWKKLSLPELTPTQIILELADRSTTRPAGIAKDVFVTGRALIDVCGKELTLRVDDEAITFKVGQTSKYSYNDAESINQIDVIDVACEEYVQEVLEFSKIPKSGNPTPTLEPIIAFSSPSFTPFEGRGIFYLEKLLNKDSSLNLPPMKNEDLKQVDAAMTKPAIEQPTELELKELPSYLEYAFFERIDKLPVIISKKLKDEEKSTLLKVLKSHKWAIALKTSDVKGINHPFCNHKILMEDDFKPTVQHQRRVNPKIHEVIKKEVIKLFDAGLIYLIFDSPWVSPVHSVPKKDGMTVIKNEDNELIPTRIAPDLEASRARGFIRRSLALLSLAYGNPIS
nr:reverse transcriptase domain-containing protein [Tanacetum cinerariifolium]